MINLIEMVLQDVWKMADPNLLASLETGPQFKKKIQGLHWIKKKYCVFHGQIII